MLKSIRNNGAWKSCTPHLDRHPNHHSDTHTGVSDNERGLKRLFETVNDFICCLIRIANPYTEIQSTIFYTKGKIYSVSKGEAENLSGYVRIASAGGIPRNPTDCNRYAPPQSIPETLKVNVQTLAVDNIVQNVVEIHLPYHVAQERERKLAG